MKRVLLACSLLLAIFFMMSCTEYDVYDISANEWAIVVPYYGDQKDQAKNVDLSEEFIQKGLITNQRVVVPKVRVNVYGAVYQNMPSAKVYRCPKAPVSRLYYNELKPDGKGGMIEIVGDKRGLATETKNSIGVTIGYSVTFQIVDPVKYFYYKANAGEFLKLADSDIYTQIGRSTTFFAASMDEMDLIASKQKLCKQIEDDCNATFGKFGIKTYNVGIYGGIIFDNDEIQKRIDARMIAAADNAAAADQVLAEEKRAKMIPYKRAWAEIDVLEAQAKYINAAAEKGIKLVPDVAAGQGTGLILDLGLKK